MINKKRGIKMIRQYLKQTYGINGNETIRSFVTGEVYSLDQILTIIENCTLEEEVLNKLKSYDYQSQYQVKAYFMAYADLFAAMGYLNKGTVH
jgi:hypothetical protein